MPSEPELPAITEAASQAIVNGITSLSAHQFTEGKRYPVGVLRRSGRGIVVLLSRKRAGEHFLREDVHLVERDGVWSVNFVFSRNSALRQQWKPTDIVVDIAEEIAEDESDSGTLRHSVVGCASPSVARLSLWSSIERQQIQGSGYFVLEVGLSSSDDPVHLTADLSDGGSVPVSLPSQQGWP